MSLFSGLNRAAQGPRLLVGGAADSFCRLERAEGPLTLVSGDGPFISLPAAHGARSPDQGLASLDGARGVATRAAAKGREGWP
jgi:hypothetical protein